MSFLPRDFVETAEGLVFAVVAHGLEDDKVLAFLRYAPDGAGYRKLATGQANALLAERYPQYLHYSPHLDARLHAVPLAAIRLHHRPRERVRALLLGGTGADAIEDKLLRLLSLLCAHGVDAACLGVTGSLLIGRQNSASDLDLVIYGRENFFRARDIVQRLVADGDLQDLADGDWRQAHERRGCELDFEEFLRHERRKGNKGMIGGVKFDLVLVDAGDAAEPQSWRKSGRMAIRARVTDDGRSFDQPARYRLDHPDIGELLSFTHTYVGQARTGELIEACGAVETAADGSRRLVVGSSREAPGEYIRVLWGQ